MAHSFPELEYLNFHYITTGIAQGLEQKLSKDLYTKLALLEVVCTMTHLDGILQHAPPLRYFSLVCGTAPRDLFLPVEAPRLFKGITHPRLTVYASTLSRLVLILPCDHIKDTEGLLMSVLQASPNLVEFCSTGPIQLNKFLEIQNIPPRIEEMTMIPEVDGVDSVIEENVRIQRQILRKLSRCSTLASATDVVFETLVVDVLIQELGQFTTADTISHLKQFSLSWPRVFL